MQASKAMKAQEAETTSKLYTLAQAAQLLGLQPVTLRAWAARRKIAVHRLGRAIRVPASEVARLLQQSFVPARPERDA
jgi:excisionase family DNA binding protein